MLTIKGDVEQTLLEAKKRNCERDAVVLIRAANVIINEIFKKVLYIYRIIDKRSV